MNTTHDAINISSQLHYVLHYLSLLSVAEFPDQASITDLVENDTIKSLARSSVAYSACSSFTALSGNSDLHLHSTGQRASVHLEKRESSVGGGSEESEDKYESDKEDEKEHREPIEHLLKVKQLTVIYLYRGYFC